MNERRIRLLMVCSFLVYFLPHGPIAVLYFQAMTGSFALAMGIFAVERASATAFEIPTGMLSDLLGRRGTLLSGIVARASGYVLFASAYSPDMLIAGAICSGLAVALFSGNNDALLYDTLKDASREQQYSTWYGRMHGIMQAGLCLSALVGGLAAMHSLRLAFAIAIIPQCIAFVFTLCFIREPKAHTDRIQPNIFLFFRGALSRFRQNRLMRTFALGSATTEGVSQALFVYTPAFFALFWPIWAVGLARTIANALGASSYWLSGSVLSRFKPLPTFLTGHAIARSFNIVAFALPTPFSPAIVSGTSLFYGVRSVAEHTLLQQQFSDAERATLASMTSFLGSLIFMIIAGSLGFLADALGPARALLLGELLFIPVMLMYAGLLRRRA